MLEVEKYMDLFKESISKRFEKQEENFKKLVSKVKSIEVTQREYKKRVRRLEDGSNADETEDIMPKHVKNILFVILVIFKLVSISMINLII